MFRPVTSLIPYDSYKGKLRLWKYSNVPFDIGAAAVKSNLTRSKPRALRI